MAQYQKQKGSVLEMWSLTWGHLNHAENKKKNDNTDLRDTSNTIQTFAFNKK